MNFLEISLKTEHTSVPAHLKIYCSDELVFDDLIDKNLVIKKQFETPKVFELKIIKTGKNIDLVKKDHIQKVQIEKVSVNGINLKINEFGNFQVHDNPYVDDHTLQTVDLNLNGTWTLQLQEQKLIGQFEPAKAKFRDAIQDCDIACFGCSQTYGVFLDHNETWPYFLGKELGLNVKNFGIPGSNYNEMTAFMEYYVKNYKAKTILALFPHSFRRQSIDNGKIEHIGAVDERNKHLIFHGEEHSIVNLSMCFPAWLESVHDNIMVSTYQRSEHNLMMLTNIKKHMLPYFDSDPYPKASDGKHFGVEHNLSYAKALAKHINQQTTLQ
jgi:hypothetical protein|tara:strand:- start:3151 stop:4128 length:978 start_codon:yes stop_codon:yes gene_type:complete